MMTTAPSESELHAELVARIERAIVRSLRSRGMPQLLEDAVLYAAGGGGKRLRPVLVLLACEAAHGQTDNAMPVAVALELIHTFSLVHDDLPAMDDDVLRRGRPTLHVQAGEALAILAGDALMSVAFELVGEADVDGDTIRDIVLELSSATTRMIDGQVLDISGSFPHEMNDAQRLRLLQRQKTGALIRAACRLGGLVAGASTEVLDALNAYGEAVGIMFQIVDDVLDVTQTTEHLGKTAGKDADAGKLTAPAVLGLDGARAEIERLRIAAHEALEPLGSSADHLGLLVDQLAARTR